MSSPIVSLGNGAWVAKNTTLSSSYNANDDQNGGWTPQQPSGSYALKAPTLTGVFYCFNRLTNPINHPSIPVLINTCQ